MLLDKVMGGRTVGTALLVASRSWPKACIGPRTSRQITWAAGPSGAAPTLAFGASYSPSRPVPTRPSNAAIAPPAGGGVHITLGGAPPSESHGVPVFSSA